MNVSSPCAAFLRRGLSVLLAGCGSFALPGFHRASTLGSLPPFRGNRSDFPCALGSLVLPCQPGSGSRCRRFPEHTGSPSVTHAAVPTIPPPNLSLPPFRGSRIPVLGFAFRSRLARALRRIAFTYRCGLIFDLDPSPSISRCPAVLIYGSLTFAQVLPAGLEPASNVRCKAHSGFLVTAECCMSPLR